MKWLKNFRKRQLTVKDVNKATGRWKELEDEITALRNTAIILGFAMTERIDKLEKLKEDITV